MKMKIVGLVALVIFTFSCNKEEITLSNKGVDLITPIEENTSGCNNKVFSMRIKWSIPLDDNSKIAKRNYYSAFFGRHPLMGIHDDGTETWIFHPSLIDQSRLVPGQCRSTIIVDEVREDPDIEDDSIYDSSHE